MARYAASATSTARRRVAGLQDEGAGGGPGPGDLGDQAVYLGRARGDLVTHGVQADEVLAAEVGGRVGNERPRVGDLGDLRLHRVEQYAGLGGGPAAR